MLFNRDTTMTFTCFVFFDMFNALSCRSQVTRRRCRERLSRINISTAFSRIDQIGIQSGLLHQQAVPVLRGRLADRADARHLLWAVTESIRYRGIIVLGSISSRFDHVHCIHRVRGQEVFRTARTQAGQAARSISRL